MNLIKIKNFRKNKNIFNFLEKFDMKDEIISIIPILLMKN